MAAIALLRKYPVVLGVTSYGTVYGISTITQQKILSHHQVDYNVVARNAFVGAFVLAPMLHGWYKLVAVVAGIGVRTWVTSVKISAAEQIVFGPLVISAFFTSTSVLSGKSLSYIKQEWKTKFLPTYAASCCFFPAVNFLNHLYVPFHLKMIYQSLVAFIWSNFICLVKERPLRKKILVTEVTEQK